MNTNTAKFATWYVRVINPRVTEYTFTARGEPVAAQKFECVLVSQDSEQYMLGLVPFDFKNRDAPKRAATKFVEDHVFEIKTPAFDTKARPEYNGCPVKPVLLLNLPTSIKHIAPTNMEIHKYPAKGITVSITITKLVCILKDSGAAKSLGRTFDFCGKYLGKSVAKQTEAKGTRRRVAEATFVDEDGGKVQVSLWDAAIEMFDDVPTDSGVVVVGCSAQKQDAELKLSIWPSAHISTAGDQAAALTALDAKTLDTQMLTATFTPGQNVQATMEDNAFPTCAAALSDAVGMPDEPRTFQINRCLLDAPGQVDLILTQDDRLFISKCRLRDRTGGVDVDVLSTAVPALYEHSTEAALRAQFGTESLTSTKNRVNARGLLRVENGVTKRYIASVETTPLQAKPSVTAMRLSLGLSNVVEDAVLAVPVNRLMDAPMLGLAAKRDKGGPLQCHRVVLLVEGTEESDCDTIDEAQIFKITSRNARCLLSDDGVFVTLAGYSDFKKMMQFRLDKETALVLGSAVTLAKPGSASDPCVVSVEHMRKVSKDERTALLISMASEWKSVLTAPDDLCKREYQSASDPAYWTPESMQKVRRLQSEPASPGPVLPSGGA